MSPVVTEAEPDPSQSANQKLNYANVPPSKVGKKEPPSKKDWWDQVEDLYLQTVSRAVTAFRARLMINYITVGTGVVLIAFSLVYSWMRGLDAFSAGIAGVGVVDFVATFYVQSQQNIEKSVEDLTKVQLVYQTYLKALENLSGYDFQARSSENGRKLDDVKETLEQYELATTRALQQLSAAAITATTQAAK